MEMSKTAQKKNHSTAEEEQTKISLNSFKGKGQLTWKTKRCIVEDEEEQAPTVTDKEEQAPTVEEEQPTSTNRRNNQQPPTEEAEEEDEDR